jgi:hypothetical protein
MTLEQSGLAALNAAGSGNLDRLRDALQARAAAIAQTIGAEASAQVLARLGTAFDIGEALRCEICSLKLRIAAERSRLAQVQTYSR